jgi:hypothetical protein
METTSEIQGQYGVDVPLAEWNKLASLPRERRVHAVQELFYPGVECECEVEPHPSDTRRQDFFPDLGDDAYFTFYQSVLVEPARQFLDIQALLKTTKQEGKLMSIVMSHVSQWVNREPEKVVDRDNNKPALRKDLIPALRARYGDKADETSRVLEQRILNDVRTNANNFTSTTLEHYLHEYPGADGDAYGARFGHKVWRDVLSLVTSFAGPTLQHKYLAGLMLGDTCTIRLPAIAQTARDLIYQIPEIANNPALQSTTAAEQLLAIMQPAIAQWIAKQRLDVPDRYREDGQPSTLRPAEERCVEGERNHATMEGQPSAAVRKRMLLPRIWEGSDTHGSIKEPTAAPSPKRGSAVTSDAGASPRTEVQDRGLLNVTVAGLNTLRKQHRSKSAISQQRAHVHSASLTTDSHHAPNPSISLSSRTPAGSGHWRKSASARMRK